MRGTCGVMFTCHTGASVANVRRWLTYRTRTYMRFLIQYL